MLPHQLTLPAHLGGVKAPSARLLPYAAIPHMLIADPRLKPVDIALIGVLLKFCGRKTFCWPAVSTLAAALGKSVRTTQYALRRLQDAGWLRSQPDRNPTGRTLHTTWREKSAGGGGATAGTGGVQRVSQQPVAPRVRPAAPEVFEDREKKRIVPSTRDQEAAPDPETQAALARLDALPAAHRDALMREASRRYGISPKATMTLSKLAAFILDHPPGADAAPPRPPGGPW